jgi:hypothetical protein
MSRPQELHGRVLQQPDGLEQRVEALALQLVGHKKQYAIVLLEAEAGPRLFATALPAAGVEDLGIEPRRQPAEVGKGRIAALVVASDGASPGVWNKTLWSKSSVSVFMSAVLKAS